MLLQVQLQFSNDNGYCDFRRNNVILPTAGQLNIM